MLEAAGHASVASSHPLVGLLYVRMSVNHKNQYKKHISKRQMHDGTN